MSHYKVSKTGKGSRNVWELKNSARVPNSPTGQVSEAGPDWPILVDVDDWTRLTWVVQSGLDWSKTTLYKRSHEGQNCSHAYNREE